MSSLADFTTHLLAENGALVEPNGDGLEVLLPADIARVLEIPEHASLSFLGERGEGFSVSYDSDILKKMAGLMGDRGKFAVVALGPSSVKLEKLEERLGDKLVFQNAVFHVKSKEEKPISYLLGYSKYFARSDDRQEGIVGCVVNELNLSAQRTTSELLDLVAHEAEGPTGQAERESDHKVLRAFWQAQLKIVNEVLSDFLISMERRMNRDIRRVHNYYQTLLQELRQALAKKLAGGDEKERTESKMAAVERELKSKIQDLIGKFSIDLQIEPISFIRIETMSPIFWLSVKRRKQARRFPLTYNPLLKSLDPLPCEACYYPRKGYYVCDDRLHILCQECFAPCARCDRVYCSACYPKDCPRCHS
jgi:hypothetical protein